ncbi:hypothetical protein bthur0004_59070 [Bacillus thuringiensis serovar sotto str. T04001]|nr:hypothetical protein bthur0004_59070 [Bacillus thuringiensis serovar sotto str. T04001]
MPIFRRQIKNGFSDSFICVFQRSIHGFGLEGQKMYLNEE